MAYLGQGEGKGESTQRGDQVYIKGLPSDFDEEKLESIFASYGNIVWKKVLSTKGKSDTAAMIQFASEEEAQWLVENLDSNIPEGLTEPVSVTLSMKKQASKGDSKGKADNKSKASCGKFGTGFGKGAQPFGCGGLGNKGISKDKSFSSMDISKGGKQMCGGKDGGKAKGKDVKPSDQVYITGLPAGFDDASLSSIFGPYGTIVWSKINNKPGLPTSTALIQFSTMEEAAWLVDNMNDNMPEGLTSPLTVVYSISNTQPQSKGKSDGLVVPFGKNMAKGGDNRVSPYGNQGAPASQKGAGKADGPKGCGKTEEAEPADQVKITGLPAGFSKDDLRSIFDAYGTIVRASVMQPKGKPDSEALVQFESVDEAQWLVENLNGNIPEGLESPVGVTYQKSYAKPEKGKDVGKASGDVQQKGCGKDYGKAAFDGQQKGKGKGDSAGSGSKGDSRSSPYGEHGSPKGSNESAEVKPGDTVVLGKLPAGFDDASLRNIFDSYGTILRSKVMQSPGKPGTSAMIQFGSVDEAKWLVENVHENIPEGLDSPITVVYHQPRSQQKGKGKDDGKTVGEGKAASNTSKGDNYSNSHSEQTETAGQNAQPIDQVIIGRLPAGFDEASLRSIFDPYGTIVWSRVSQSKGKSESSALIQFSSVEEAQWLVENVNENIPEGLESAITVAYDAKRQPKGKGKADGKAVVAGQQKGFKGKGVAQDWYAKF